MLIILLRSSLTGISFISNILIVKNQIPTTITILKKYQVNICKESKKLEPWTASKEKITILKTLIINNKIIEKTKDLILFLIIIGTDKFKNMSK